MPESDGEGFLIDWAKEINNIADELGPDTQPVEELMESLKWIDEMVNGLEKAAPAELLEMTEFKSLINDMKENRLEAGMILERYLKLEKYKATTPEMVAALTFIVTQTAEMWGGIADWSTIQMMANALLLGIAIGELN